MMKTLEVWIQDYTSQRTCLARKAVVDQRLLNQFASDFQVLGNVQTPTELFARTDFLIEWAKLRDWAHRPRSATSDELIAVRTFAEWLLGTGRTSDNVYFYVRPKFEAVLKGDIPRLWLRHNLQLDIARFRQTLDGTRHKWDCVTLTQAAHSWNIHLNREQAGREQPEVNEELLLSWLGKTIQDAPSRRRAAELLKGLSSFFEYLVAKGKQVTNPVGILLARDSCRSHFRIINIAAAAATPKPRDIGNELAQLDPFRSGLKVEFEACLRYLDALKLGVRKYGYAFQQFDRILHHAGIERPVEITSESLEAFLLKGDPAIATRNQRLVRIRRFFKFLVRRGFKLSIPWQQWRRQPVPHFRPHIYSVKEVESLLHCVRHVKATDPIVPHSVELVLFLCYACGMRLGEPVSLRVRDVQLEQGLIFIDRTKFYKQRWAPYGKAADRRLREYWQRRCQLFPERCHPEEPFFLGPCGTGLKKATVGRLFREAAHQQLAIRSRGTRRPRIHDLRHSFAVHRLHKWYNDGADVQNKLPLLTAYMGHVHIRHTEVYLHLAEDLLRQAGRGFELSFRAALEQEGQT